MRISESLKASAVLEADYGWVVLMTNSKLEAKKCSSIKNLTVRWKILMEEERREIGM